MKRILLSIATSLFPIGAQADNAAITEIVHHHILPRFERLADASETLATVASADCSASSAPLRAAFSDTFDAWVSASHLRFGPTEVDDRAFAIAFWPDSRGATPKALNKLIADQDPIAMDVHAYSDASVAARGLYAMEFLLFDDVLSKAGGGAYHCKLIKTIAADTAAMASAISSDWVRDYAPRLLTPSPDGTYRTEGEVLRELLKALSTGLQFTSETRLGRPLGTFLKPRPKRAEAWRSGRSSYHVALTLQSLERLAIELTGDDAILAAKLSAAFDKSLAQLTDLNDPVFAGVSFPQSRLKIEVIKQSVETIRTIVREQLGPKLGVAAGFNSLDGD